MTQSGHSLAERVRLLTAIANGPIADAPLDDLDPVLSGAVIKF